MGSSSIFGANNRFVKEAVARKVREYRSITEPTEIGTPCESREVNQRRNLQA